METVLSTSKWVHKKDYSENYTMRSGSTRQVVACIQSPILDCDGAKISGFVWLWDNEGYIEVFNIVPTEPGSLSYSEYNHILQSFQKDVINLIVMDMGLSVEVTKPHKSIEDIIGDDAALALRSFSVNANKSTGRTHPFDFNRWCDFVFIIHRRKIPLNSEDFVRWLRDENGWSDKMAWELALDLEYSQNLLEKYDKG